MLLHQCIQLIFVLPRSIVKSFAIFWCILICNMYITWMKLWKVYTIVDSIEVFGVLTCCALLHSMYDLKAAQMNMQCSLIWELMLHKFELGHNASEAAKSFYWTKGERTVDNSTVTRWFKKFCLYYYNLRNQARSSRPKTMDSKAVLQAIETDLMSNTWRVSGELSISQSSMVHHVHVELYFILPKYCKTFESVYCIYPANLNTYFYIANAYRML